MVDYVGLFNNMWDCSIKGLGKKALDNALKTVTKNSFFAFLKAQL
jgi:hypothetical protein